MNQRMNVREASLPSFEDLLAKSVAMHGHLCPGQVLCRACAGLPYYRPLEATQDETSCPALCPPAGIAAPVPRTNGHARRAAAALLTRQGE
jgi:hypothetical protein